MVKKATKIGMMILAAVLLVGLAFAGAASADYVEVSTWDELKNSVADWTETDTARIVAVTQNIDKEVDPSQDYGIDVNGNVIVTTTENPDGDEVIINGTGEGRLFWVNPQGNLTICGNASSATINLTNGNVNDDDAGGAIIIEGKFTLSTGAKITNCIATRGGAVYVDEGGVFNMTGGCITSCNATAYDDGGYFYIGYGGAVYISEGTFNMTGGYITSCNADDVGGIYDSQGGAVYVIDGCTFTMSGGSISDCYANNGGAVYLYNDGADGAAFTMTNGSISDCKVCTWGGAVYVDDGCTFTMSNGSITGGEASRGGGVYLYNGAEFTMSNGSISDCNASYTGGAVHIDSYAEFTMSGNAEISHCTSTWGGGVGNYGQFTMTNGCITSCSAEGDYGYGGGVANGYGGSFIMSGGTIESCSAPYGSGVDQYGTFIVNGTAIISSDNDVALFEDDGYYPNIIVDADSGFTGEIQNITLYVYNEDADEEIESPKNWLQQVIVVNGEGFADQFQLSPAYIDDEYELTASGDDLILTGGPAPVYKKKSSGQTGYTVILTETPTPVATSAPTQSSSDNATVILPTNNPSVKPTTTTSASPAPFVGLVLGLGAAAVLLRLRK